MIKLFIFTKPSLVNSKLTLDNGTSIDGMPDVHPSGREGYSFVIPNDAPNGNGSQLVIEAEGKVPIHQRGILWLSGNSASFNVDDFYLEDS